MSFVMETPIQCQWGNDCCVGSCFTVNMTTLMKRTRYSSLDDKTADEDKCNNYTDTMMTEGRGEMELKTISEGSSGSSIAEMNNNTNGKVLTIGPSHHGNTNDNRQQQVGMMTHQAPPIQAPSGIQGPPGGTIQAPKNNSSSTVMKKIKQIYMDEVPLHLSGLSISGSGMELFVKLDEHLDTALRQASRTISTRQGKKRKKMTRTKAKKLKTFPRTLDNTGADAQPDRKTYRNDPLHGMDQEVTKKDVSHQAGDQLIGALRMRTRQSAETTTDQSVEKDVDVMATQSKPSVRDSVRQLTTTPQDHRQSGYFPYGWNQNFQQEKPTTLATNYKTNIIRGPTWNEENGEIDIIRSQGNLQSASNVQTTMVAKDTRMDYDIPVDYSMNPFPGGFESKNLPLKRRPTSPPRWQIRHVTEDRHVYDERYHDNDNACSSNDYVRKERIRHVKEGKVRKLQQEKKTAQRRVIPSTSQDAALVAAERSFMPIKADVKGSQSEMSNAQVSSVGPQFQTDLLTPQTMDAETLIKFTEYTHDLRKDLKQKYKDLSKLLKTFEETVQHKNGGTDKEREEEGTEPEAQVGRCAVM